MGAGTQKWLENSCVNSECVQGFRNMSEHVVGLEDMQKHIRMCGRAQKCMQELRNGLRTCVGTWKQLVRVENM